MPSTVSETKLDRLTRQAALINDIVAEMRSTLILDNVLQTTVDRLCEALLVNRTLVYRVDPSSPKTANHVREATREAVSLIGATCHIYSYYHQRLVRGEAVAIAHLESQTASKIEDDENLRELGSILIVPLLHEQTYLGGICLHQCDRQREWSEEDLKFVQAIASHCAVAIHQCELYQQARKELAQHKQEEVVLLQNTSELLAIFQVFPDFYFRVSGDGTILSCHTGQTDDLYAPPEVFLNKRIQDVLPPDVGHQISEALLQAISTKRLVATEYALPFPTECKHFEARLLPLFDNEIIAIVRDITDRKQAEESLKKQKEFLRQVIDTNPNLIFVKDWEGKFILVNQALAHTYGTTVEGLLGKSDADFNPDLEEVERFIAADREAMTTGIPKIIPEETVTDSTGNVRWYQTIKQPLISPDGKVRQVVGVATDITDCKLAETALQKAKDELEIKVSERTNELKNAFEQLQLEISERQLAETLLEGQNSILKMIATGVALPDILNEIAHFIEQESDEAICTILLLDESGTKLLPGAAPSLPESYAQAIADGIEIGSEAGSCGTAAYCKATVITSDIVTDPKWVHCKDFVLSYGLRACWSTPLFGSDSDVLGTFALYYRTPSQSNQHDQKLVQICSQLAAIAIERQRAEEILGESKERFRHLIESTSDCIWEIDENAVYTYVSPKIRELLGYEPEEVLGKTYFEFLLEEEAAFAAQLFAVIAAKRMPFSYLVNTYLHKDGREVLLESSGVPFFDVEGKLEGYRGLNRDMSDRKQAEDIIKQSEDKFRNIVEQTNDWVWECDSNIVFTYVNPKIIDILGYEPEEVIGKTTFDFMSSDEAKQFATVLEQFLSKQAPFTNLEKTLQHKNGHLVVLETSGSPVFGHQGLLQGYRGITRDITERKRVEQEIRKALTKEKELGELKSRFVTMTSHEFRTPLSTILSSAELLQNYSYKFTEQTKLKHLQRIQTAVHHMTQLLNDVLILGKVEAGKLDCQSSLLNLEKFCADLVEDLQLSAGNSIAINFVSRGKCYDTYFDERILRHILNNLLSNAIKYSPQGGNINFELNCHADEAIFKIQDRGIGIPPEDLGCLFDSFHRATNVGNIPGTGLGLAVVKKCVDLQNGKITVQSQVGSGTTFTVSLPLKN